MATGYLVEVPSYDIRKVNPNRHELVVLTICFEKMYVSMFQGSLMLLDLVFLRRMAPPTLAVFEGCIDMQENGKAYEQEDVLKLSNLQRKPRFAQLFLSLGLVFLIFLDIY